MAVQRTAKIPFTRVIKIGIWDNHTDKSTMNTVYGKLVTKYPGKEVYIANGGFFGMNNQRMPCWGCKADGKMVSNDWATQYTAYFTMNGKDIAFHRYTEPFPDSCSDGISVYPPLLEHYSKSSSFHNYPDGTTDRGRTMIGYNGQYVVLSCIADTIGTSDFTCNEEVTFMKEQGCMYAGNLDGGGSTQCNFNGGKITSTRIVSNFIYIIAEPSTTSNPATNKTTSHTITTNKAIQTWLNETYDSGLTVDGSLGTLSKKAIIKGMQTECGVTADGSWGPKSKASFKALSRGSKNNTVNKVKLIECALARKGFWSDSLIGTFNDTLYNKVMLYQKSVGLVVDGSVGPATITSLFN